MTKLTKYEKETIISFNQDETTANVYTCDEAWIRQMDKLAKNDPRIQAVGKDEYSKSYLVPKKAVKVRMPRTISDEKRKEMGLRMMKSLHNK